MPNSWRKKKEWHSELIKFYVHFSRKPTFWGNLSDYFSNHRVILNSFQPQNEYYLENRSYLSPNLMSRTKICAIKTYSIHSPSALFMRFVFIILAALSSQIHCAK